MSNTATLAETSSKHRSEDLEGTDDDARLSSHDTVGAVVLRGAENPSRQVSWVSQSSAYPDTPATGAQTPDPLFRNPNVSSRVSTGEQDIADVTQNLEPSSTHDTTPHLGDALANLARSMSNAPYDHTGNSYELRPTMSRRQPSSVPAPRIDGLADESGSPTKPMSQGVPPELKNFASEVVFVLVCSAGQLLFAWFLGDVNVNQSRFKEELGLQSTQLPWLGGAFNVANALSVVLAGSLTDLAPPKSLVVGAFVWLTVWNIIGAFALTPSRSILFFMVRAMQGLAIGVLVSGSMSILGRVYNPGLRKTRVFSCMAAMAPFGFWLGALQGGALSAHLEWVFGTNAILCGLFTAAGFFSIPSLKPVADYPGADAPSLRQFDYLGAVCAIVGCVCLLFGITQGPAASWSPYTYVLIIIGLIFVVGFFFAEQRASRPLIPNRLWRTKGFSPLMAAYFLGFGSFVAWQFYAIQFWLRIQHVSPMTVALYLLPNAIMGVLATFIVSRIMHLVPGHWIFVASMVAFALGPTFFLPQTAGTTYWALSMPGVALVTFGPDLSFAAASIFITSNVSQSYQGSAGSLLMTVQNLSAAIMTSVADALGAQIDLSPAGEVGLKGLRAIWWFSLGATLLGALITVVGVRIPKEVEKEHVK